MDVRVKKQEIKFSKYIKRLEDSIQAAEARQADQLIKTLNTIKAEREEAAIAMQEKFDQISAKLEQTAQKLESRLTDAFTRSLEEKMHE